MSTPSLSAASPELPVDSGLSRAARGSVLNLIGAAFSAICSFVLVAVITRRMDRADAGVFFSVTSLFLVASAIGQLGTNVGLVYFLARARALGQRSMIDRYLRTAIRPVLIVGVAMTLALLVLAPELARLTNHAHAHQATSYIRITALFVAPACLGTALLAATRGMGTMRANVVVEQIGRQILQVLFVAIAVALPSAGLIAWAWSLPYAVSLLAALLWWRTIRRRAKFPDTDSGTPEAVGREFWRFTGPRTIGSIVLLLIQRVDIVLVGAIAGAVQAAVFTASTRFVVAGQMGGLAVSLAVQPPLAAALARRDHAASLHLFQTSAAWLMGVTWPLYLTFCVNGHTLLGVFGHGYSSGSTILLLVTIGLLVGVACGDVDSVQTMSGRTLWSLGNAVLGLSVMVGLDLWLIPIHGALGAGVGWGCAMAVKNLAGLVQIWRALDLHPFGTALITMGALNLVCFGGVEILARLLPLAGVLTLVIGLALASGVYLIGLWVLRSPLRLDEFLTLRRRRPPGAHAVAR